MLPGFFGAGETPCELISRVLRCPTAPLGHLWTDLAYARIVCGCSRLSMRTRL